MRLLCISHYRDNKARATQRREDNIREFTDNQNNLKCCRQCICLLGGSENNPPHPVLAFWNAAFQPDLSVTSHFTEPIGHLKPPSLIFLVNHVTHSSHHPLGEGRRGCLKRDISEQENTLTTIIGLCSLTE